MNIIAVGEVIHISNVVIVLSDEEFSVLELELKKIGVEINPLRVYGRGNTRLSWEIFLKEQISGHVRDDVTDEVIR